MNKDDIRRSPGDFLYAFLSNEDILSIASIMGPGKADVIQYKRLNQIKLLKGAYNGTINFDELAGWVKSAYGYSPREVFLKLLAGENVAGKDWKKGVYGVGATPSNKYADSSYTVDESTGKLFNNEGVLAGGIPIFSNGTNGTYISGYTYLLNDTTYTSKLGEDGKFYANTYGNESGAWFADGSVYSIAKGSNFWEGLSTFYPIVKSIITSLIKYVVNLFGSSKSSNNKEITAENTVPKQEEFMVEESRKSMIPILILVLAGGWFLLKKKG